MPKRIYSSSSDARTLNGQIYGTPSPTTVIVLNTVSSNTLPTEFPFTLVIDPDVTGKEEIVTVLSSAGTYSYNVNRGSDGTSAKDHDSGAVVKHMVTARDMQEPQNHIEATGVYTIKNDGSDAGVTTSTIVKPLHGLTTGDGDVVGSDKIQTLTRKTLTNPTVNAASLTGTITNGGTISGGTISGSTLTGTTTLTGTISANSLTVDATELSYLDGVTSNIQTQFTAKAPLASPTFTGTVTLPSGTALTTPTLTSPTINGATINSASTIGGVSGTTISADHSAWTSTTPTITSGWSGTPTLRYIQVGKTVHFRYMFVSNGSSSATEMVVNLPVAAGTSPSVRNIAFGEWLNSAGTSRFLLSAPIVTSGTSSFTIYYQSGGTGLSKLSNTVPGTAASGDTIVIAGTYEAA